MDYKTAELICYINELIGCAVGSVSSALLIVLTNKVREFHSHLRTLITVSFSLLIVFAICRMIMVPIRITYLGVPEELLPEHIKIIIYYVMILHDYCNFSFGVIFVVLSGDRLFSTYHASKYEKSCHSLVLHLVCYATLLFACSIPFILEIVLGWEEERCKISAYIIFFMAIFRCLLDGTLWFKNQEMRKVISQSLSKKFQHRENVKVLRALLPVTFLWTVVKFVSASSVFYLTFIMDQPTSTLTGWGFFMFRFAAQSFNVTNAAFVSAAPWIIILRTERYRMRLFHCCRRRGGKVQNVPLATLPTRADSAAATDAAPPADVIANTNPPPPSYTWDYMEVVNRTPETVQYFNIYTNMWR